MNPMLCVIAGQRSGTTAFDSALGATGKFFNFGEIFHTQEDGGRPAAFLSFIRDKGVSLEDLATYRTTEILVEEFLAHLASSANGRIPLIDVKLNSWNVIHPFWAYPLEKPFFLQSLQTRGAAFVFVIRRDLVGQVLSEEIARAVNKWHELQSDDVPAPITVDVRKVRRRAENILQSERFLFDHLTGYRSLITATYETLFEDGCVSARLTEQVARTLRTPPLGRVKVGLQKNKGRKENLVSNFAEIQDAIDGLVAKCGRVF